MLKRLGHQVVSVAENGRELVEHCRQQRPDLVITDIKMPEMDGIEASQEICRERPVPIILVSAFQDGKLIERAEADSVLAYLVKPIGPDDLVPAIAIARRRFEELTGLRKESADLRQALTDRKVIEQAKGVLMKVAGLDEPTAFRRLQGTGRRQESETHRSRRVDHRAAKSAATRIGLVLVDVSRISLPSTAAGRRLRDSLRNLIPRAEGRVKVK